MKLMNLYKNEMEVLMELNLQLFASEADSDAKDEAESKNYELLRAEVLSGNSENVSYSSALLPIIHEIDEAEGNETVDNVDHLKLLLEEALIPENQKAIISKKIRVLQKRVERRLTTKLGEVVRSLRTAANLSLRELEAMTGVTASYINRIESGHKTAPSIAVVKQLSEGLGYDLFQIYASRAKSSKVLKEYLLKDSYILNNGEEATLAQKESLYKIFNIIQEREFKKTQAADAMMLLEEIQNFKELESVVQ